jgi:hypothetical protein
MTITVRRYNGELPDFHFDVSSAERDGQGYLTVYDAQGALIGSYAPGDWASVVREDRPHEAAEGGE